MKRSNTHTRSGIGSIGWALIAALGFVGIIGGTGCDEVLDLGDLGYGDVYGYDDSGWYDGGGYDSGWYDGGSYYSNPYLGTAVSYADGDGYIAFGDGTFY